MKTWLVVIVLLLLASPFSIMWYVSCGEKAERKYANPPPATIPTTFLSDRFLFLPVFILCCILLPPSLALIVTGIREDAWRAGTLPLLLGVLTFIPSAWYFWRLGYRLIRPDALILSEQGITWSTMDDKKSWAWQDIADADYEPKIRPISQAQPCNLYLYLRDGSWESLGNNWSGPFGLSAAIYLANVIRATLAVRNGKTGPSHNPVFQ